MLSWNCFCTQQVSSNSVLKDLKNRCCFFNPWGKQCDFSKLHNFSNISQLCNDRMPFSIVRNIDRQARRRRRKKASLSTLCVFQKVTKAQWCQWYYIENFYKKKQTCVFTQIMKWFFLKTIQSAYFTKLCSLQ